MKLPIIYLDCCATTPIEQEVLDAVILYMKEEFGNAASRTHGFGSKAKQAVEEARKQVADVVGSKPEEVIFTSGATESDNLAIIGLAEFGEKTGKKHFVGTKIEHKAVLEPLEVLSKKGFEITLVPPTSGGWVDPEAIRRALRKDTLLVSVMHVNNETGVLQPIEEICQVLANHSAYFHVDGAQGFGKEIEQLRNNRIDLLSVSAHKIYGPKGIGALITRRREYRRPPIVPLIHGGGHEYGFRPGTLPVQLIVGFGKAAELALREVKLRNNSCKAFRARMLNALQQLEHTLNGDQNRTLAHVINLSFPNLDSEAVMLALRDLIAFSNGSACTSQSYEPSHVLKSMGLSEDVIRGAVRMSWCHMSEYPDWDEVVSIIKRLY